MDCFRCGRRADYDRVAVERSTGETLGSYCDDCEADLASRAADGSAPSMAACLRCGGDPDVLFPQWDTLVERDDGRIDHEYTISLDTPAYCLACAVWTASHPTERRSDRVATD
jgi:hypothetical protein